MKVVPFAGLAVVSGLFHGLWVSRVRTKKQTLGEAFSPLEEAVHLLWPQSFMISSYRAVGKAELPESAGGQARRGLGLSLFSLGVTLASAARITLGDQWKFDFGPVRLEPDHELRTEGPYALLRHPLYAGLILMTSGLALAYPKKASLAWAAWVASAYPVAARMEEKKLLERYGKTYAQYQQQVPMFFPRQLKGD